MNIRSKSLNSSFYITEYESQHLDPELTSNWFHLLSLTLDFQGLGNECVIEVELKSVRSNDSF